MKLPVLVVSDEPVDLELPHVHVPTAPGPTHELDRPLLLVGRAAVQFFRFEFPANKWRWHRGKLMASWDGNPEFAAQLMAYHCRIG